jgi:hypothetical protein
MHALARGIQCHKRVILERQKVESDVSLNFQQSKLGLPTWSESGWL